MIQETTEYEKFKFLSSNREISKPHVLRLIQDIQSTGLLHHILVDKDYYILDGQHRFEALKYLGLPIPFEVSEKLTKEHISSLNLQKKWSTEDFIHKFSEEGNEDCKKVLQFKQKLNTSVAIAAHLLCGRHQINKKIVSGDLTITREFSEEDLYTYFSTIDIIKSTTGNQKFLTTYKFISALFDVIQCEGFDEKVWFNNLKKLSNKVVPRVSYSDYVSQFELIYNYRQIQKISVKGI